jgi:PhnB protein
MSIHEVFPYLRVRGADAAVDFYRRAFGVEELFRLVEPSGRIGHVELRFGGTIVMLSEEFPEFGIHAPAEGGLGASIHLHVDDADAVIESAVAAGAVVLRPARDQFHGERSGAVRDPFGHEWLIGSTIEEGVTPEEMQRRYTAMFDPPKDP